MIIGVDHGFGLIKTAHYEFVSGVKKFSLEPPLFNNVIEYNKEFYFVGGERQSIKDSKVDDENFYILTLAAIANEMKHKGLTRGNVVIAAGLPLTRIGREKNNFRKYLLKDREVYFKYEGTAYSIHIEDIDIYPQGYAAIVDKLEKYTDLNLLIDIGSWTIDILPIQNKVPDVSKCVTLNKGFITCIGQANEELRRLFGNGLQEIQIQRLLKDVDVKLPADYKEVVIKTFKEYANDIRAAVRELGYNLDTTQITYMGGGAQVIKNYSLYNQLTSFVDDIHANAIGFENISKQKRVVGKVV